MFFWYRLTRVFPDKFHRAVKRLCVCVCVCDIRICLAEYTDYRNIDRSDSDDDMTMCVCIRNEFVVRIFMHTEFQFDNIGCMLGSLEKPAVVIFKGSDV